MKKLPVIFISSIILISVIFILLFLAEPYRIKRHDRFAQPIFKKAEKQYKNRSYSNALAMYKKVVDKYYKSRYTFKALEKVVEILDNAHKRKDEAEYLKKFLRLFLDKKESAKYIYKLADIEFMFLGEMDKAKKYYEIVIRKYPKSNLVKKAKMKLAELAHRMEDPKKAIKKTSKALEDMSTSKDKDYLLLKNAEGLWKIGEHSKAYKTIKEIGNPAASFIKNHLVYNQILIKYEPTSGNYRNLESVFKRLGFLKRARAAGKKAVEIEGKK